MIEGYLKGKKSYTKDSLVHSIEFQLKQLFG